ncbi:cupin [Maritimibacter sp. 55A14]|uniref:cupin domain-containing protein n=1 Tax=Maritimibacter sp. 55A14 TaxID=2174844 RepID=UPI000D60D2C6|nr:cupin domain-containing protein [Maritimibacter sp. 55A14]PWE33971.1 cupin [Maritimibacter sp. 55A14]
MQPIAPEDRRVANIREDAFVPFPGSDGQPDGEVLQVNGGRTGYGFHVYRMAPGTTTEAHEHLGDEEFLLIEGDLTDHDGHVYRPGDLVWLRSGTRHNSSTVGGCLLAVYLPDARSL